MKLAELMKRVFISREAETNYFPTLYQLNSLLQFVGFDKVNFMFTDDIYSWLTSQVTYKLFY
jgi:hypothetical protein